MMSMLSLAPHISKFMIISASAVISFLPMLIPFCCGAREYRLCFVGLMALCAILLVYVLVERKRISYRFDIMDLSIAVYLTAGLLNMAFTAKSFPEPLWFCRWGAVVVAYLSGRIILQKQKDLLYLFLSVSGAVESLIAILQYMGLFKVSLNGYFPHSGSFQTPGALGVFVALAIICNVYLIYCFVKIKKRLVASLLGLCLAVSVAGLVVLDSRTAMIALIVAALIYFARVLEKRRLKLRYLFYLVTAVLMVFAVVAIYIKRSDSVKTRMLLWKVALTMNRDNVVTGNGVSSFSRDYMPCQEAYFRANPSSEYALFANNHYQSYNAFLQIYVEQGVVGIIIITLLLGLVLKRARKDKPPFYLLIGWATASCFLYISDILPFMVLLGVFMGITEKKNKADNKDMANSKPVPRGSNKVVNVSLATFLTGCIILGAIHLNRYNSAYNSIGSSTQNSLYNKNMHFAALTAKSAFNSDSLNVEEKIFIMKARMQRFSTSEMLIDLGDLYLSANRYMEAEESYIRAFYMVPCRIIPLYKLFLLYQGIGNEQKAADIAKRIVALKASVVSSLTIQLKQEAAKYLLPDK